MSIDRTLLEVLACPSCKGPLAEVRADGAAAPTATGEVAVTALDCRACRLRFPVTDDIPVMLVDHARRIPG